MKTTLNDKKKTVLEQLFDKSIPHPYGCLGGVCGACKLKKPLVGEVENIEEEIAFIEESEFLPCISKIKKDCDYIEVEI